MILKHPRGVILGSSESMIGIRSLRIGILVPLQHGGCLQNYDWSWGTVNFLFDFYGLLSKLMCKYVRTPLYGRYLHDVTLVHWC